ncbi:MAG: hypothetical protein JWP97_4056 [Labilithrix sp.]|nr:hypothetical protein [Labilithrix sp.]
MALSPRGRARLLGLVFAAACPLLVQCNLLVDTDGLAGAPADDDAGVLDTAAPDTALVEAASDAPRDVVTEEASGPSPAEQYALAVLGDMPLLYFKLDEKNGSTAKNEASSADGAYFGDVTLRGDGAFPGSRAALFSGNAAGIQTATAPAWPDRHAFTFETWWKPLGFDDTFRFLFHLNGGTSAGREDIGVNVQSGSGLTFERFMASAPSAIHVPLPPVAQWRHLAATYDGSVLRLYVDGLLVGSAPDERTTVPHDGPFIIGGSDPMAGAAYAWLDEVAIYDRALAADRIAAHFAIAPPR